MFHIIFVYESYDLALLLCFFSKFWSLQMVAFVTWLTHKDIYSTSHKDIRLIIYLS